MELVEEKNVEQNENQQQKEEYEIVKRAANGDRMALEYIMAKYKNFVRVKAKSYFLIGADREDIIQEGMIDFIRLLEILMKLKLIRLDLLLKFV